MNLFYSPDLSGDVYTLDEEESRHCQKVLRLIEGDTVHLTDGQGTLYEARIIDARSKKVQVEVISRQVNFGRKDFRIHLAVAPTKNIERFEWFLEKATEIGIDEITPILCEHSERRNLRPDRLNRIITAALKQSLKAYHPVLNSLTDFKKFIGKDRTGQRFIAHLEEEKPVQLQSVCKRGNDVTVIIGPEGDFSIQELEMARKEGYICVALGDSRLRTETAAVVACHSINFINQ